MQLSLALAYKSDGEALSRISKETRFQNICLPSVFGLCPAHQLDEIGFIFEVYKSRIFSLDLSMVLNQGGKHGCG